MIRNHAKMIVVWLCSETGVNLRPPSLIGFGLNLVRIPTLR
jgi:hypothetical protein